MANAWDACTLSAAERPRRDAEFDALVARSARRVSRPEPGLVRLILDGTPETEQQAAGLAAREKDCCAFFDFSFTRAGEELVLDARVPAGYEEVLDYMTARTRRLLGEGNG